MQFPQLVKVPPPGDGPGHYEWVPDPKVDLTHPNRHYRTFSDVLGRVVELYTVSLMAHDVMLQTEDEKDVQRVVHAIGRDRSMMLADFRSRTDMAQAVIGAVELGLYLLEKVDLALQADDDNPSHLPTEFLIQRAATELRGATPDRRINPWGVVFTHVPVQET